MRHYAPAYAKSPLLTAAEGGSDWTSQMSEQRVNSHLGAGRRHKHDVWGIVRTVVVCNHIVAGVRRMVF
jgi:zona occludens toxin (predicted ATPase)